MSLTLLIVQFIILMTVLRGASKRITQLEQEVGALRERMMQLDKNAAQPVPAPSAISEVVEEPATMAAPDTPALVTEASAPEPEENVTASVSAVDEDMATAPANNVAPANDVVPASTPALQKVEEPTREPESLENLLGARWAVWAGGLALALGGLFLVRYSIESGLLGPGVRLTLAALFGLALVAVGELIRRKALPQMAALHENAMIPGILTAAGAVCLFGAIYAAHGIYAFIGPTLAFILLAVTAFSVLGLSLLHGQSLAGLGLAGSMLTPVLISTTSPNLWTLFIYLTVAQVATSLASRLKGWLIVPAIAQGLLGIWAVVALLGTYDITPIALSLLAMIAAWMLIWPGNTGEDPAEPKASLSFEALGRRMSSGPVGLDITMSLAVLLPALMMLERNIGDLYPLFGLAALITALAAAGSSRHGAFWPTAISVAGALLAAIVETGMVGQAQAMLLGWDMVKTSLPALDVTVMYVLLGLASVFLLIALAQIRRRVAEDPLFSTVWAVIAAAVPVILATISFVFYGIYAFDLTHGLFALAITAILLGTAEFTQGDAADSGAEITRDVLVLGSFATLVLSLHTLTDGLATTLALAVSGFAYLMATRLRNWRILPWMMVLGLAGVLARIALDPTLVGAEALSRTPVFNQLLLGYGLPAVLAILGAWQMRNWPSPRLRNALQGLAALFGLLAVAILVRHAMNGGVLDSSTPTLGEQSIYTLLVIGLSGILMTLDLRAPSSAFHFGSMIAGGLSMLQVLSLHLGALNPYFTGESTGNWPLINLLLIGYLIPGLGYAGLAYYARGRRPVPYVTLLALSGAVLGFAWVTLSVRRFWHGPYIAEWNGFGQAETYSYSVTWLVIGVVLLVLGSRFNARSLRIASAVVVMISVGKAFLIDMSNLEGVLRALSFIGLGFVLIGIGLFYQKMLTGTPKPREAEPAEGQPQPSD